MTRIVIIGAGQAGAATAVALRQRGHAGPIVLLGDEGVPPYERPELSKGYLDRSTAFDTLVALTPETAAAEGIDLKVGAAARAIDRETRTVETEAGPIAYDGLVIATGGRPREVPATAATERPVLTLRSRADADRLHEGLADARRVTIVGGGWLGLEVAASAVRAGCAVDVVERADRLCARAVGPDISGDLLALHTDHGVRVRLSADPAFSAGRVTDGGESWETDLVVVTTGLRANDALAAEAGLDVDDGVLVDEAGATGDPAIHAVGDVARYRTSRARPESWQHANVSAERVAASLMGVDPPATPAPWFWSYQHGQLLQMVGAVPAASSVSRGEERPVRLYLDGDRLVGCAAWDAPRVIGQARRQLGRRVLLDRLSDPSNDLKTCLAPDA